MNFWNSSFSWIILIMVSVLDCIIPFFIAPFYKGYSHKKMVMSILGSSSSPVYTFYNIWMIISGSILIIESFNLYIKYNLVSIKLSKVLLVLILIYAIFDCVISSIFSIDKNGKIKSNNTKIHSFASAIGLIAFTITPFIISILSFKAGENISGVISIISFIITVIASSLFALSKSNKFKDTIISYKGLWQRISFIFIYIPYIYVASNSL
ncbi:hypothetical protein JCM1393_07750 [Clostridium carnis]